MHGKIMHGIVRDNCIIRKQKGAPYWRKFFEFRLRDIMLGIEPSNKSVPNDSRFIDHAFLSVFQLWSLMLAKSCVRQRFVAESSFRTGPNVLSLSESGKMVANAFLASILSDNRI